MAKCKTIAEIYKTRIAYVYNVADKLGKDMEWNPITYNQYIWIYKAIQKAQGNYNGFSGISLKNFKGQWKIFIEKSRWINQ